MACSGNGAFAPVIVERPNQFVAKLPPKWRVIIPDHFVDPRDGTDPEKIPVFSAYSPDVADVTFILFAERDGSDLNGIAEQWRESIRADLADFAVKDDAIGRSMLASGPARPLKGSDAQPSYVTIAVVRFSARPESAWVLMCTSPDAGNSFCTSTIAGFAPVRPPGKPIPK